MIYKLRLFIIHNIKTCQNIVVEMLQLSLIPINEFTIYIYIHTYLITKINISRYCQYIYIYMHMPTIIILILKYFIIYIVIY